jgi:hypothetical protein
MSRFTPVDFISPKVEVSIVYDVDPVDGWKAKWVNGTIQTVGKRGTFENSGANKFVVCEIVLDSEVLITETLYDSDYECDTDFAWRFSPSFTPLVNQLMKFNDPMEIDSQGESESETDEDDPEYEPSTEGTDDESGDETSEVEETEDYDDGESTDDYEDYNVVYKKTPSLTNRFFATMFVLSPWFASVAVVYHARDDIFNYLQKKYC